MYIWSISIPETYEFLLNLNELPSKMEGFELEEIAMKDGGLDSSVSHKCPWPHHSKEHVSR